MKKLATEYTPIKRMIDESNRRLLIDMGFFDETGAKKLDITEGIDILRDARGRTQFVEGDENLHTDIIRDERGRVSMMSRADVSENKIIHWYIIRDERGRVVRMEPYEDDLEDLFEDEGVELYDESDRFDSEGETTPDEDLTEFEAMTEDEMIEEDEENEFSTTEQESWGD